ncbi:hypothetical protein AXG93_2062s1300 [Marchantia polymorpha subsp. ruderalis]|uniref:Uncharacterized protein n=1 Tax=Marchantia polymorpha subsp. ruderalis TaxID=1480154 RepID=A0A176VE21_MARPO|nr:hypothetical protein AXG93_2062s1300 [Marchantia polymorpha subsp. ruderalis]
MEPQMDVKVSTFSFKEGEMLSVRVLREMGFYQVELTVREPDMTLHWGVDDWSLPDKSWWPDGTITVGAKSLETSFTFVCQDHWQVLMRFSETAAPKHLVFVLRDKAGTWYNNGGCFSVMVKPLELKDLMNQIVVPETSYSNWSLFSRFVLASNLLDAAEALGAEGMALVYTWLRFSSNKQLGWYRNCNYQSKDIAHVQERLASLMAQKVKRGRNSPVRLFARMSLSTLPRGGGDSEQIRMGILNIMREHGIKEGHRDRGGVTKEWLEKMDHPISARPLFLPQLIPAFKHFLWVLKTVHSGADLDVAMEMSKKYMDEDLKDLLYHILSNRSTWWIPGKIVEARKRMEPICRADWSSRDVLMLDIALDSFFGLSISRIDKARLSTIVPVLYMRYDMGLSSLSGDDICELISLVLENACINTESPELNMCLNLWYKVKRTNRWTQEWALLALAAVDRISQALQGYVDSMYQFVQPQAETLGKLCGIETSYIYAFGEEIASHQALARGTVMVLPSLASIQGHVFPSSRVVIIDSIGGLEDIPVGVTAVLSSSTTDILSHVSIRARNNKVLLASCSDSEEFETMKRMEGKTVVVTIQSTGEVVASEELDSFLQPVQGYSPMDLNESNKKPNQLTSPLKRCPPALVPASVVLPLTTYEQLLNDPLNEMAASLLKKVLRELDAASKSSNAIPKELALIRKIIKSKVTAPEVMKDALCAAAEASGLIGPGAWKNQLVWENNWRAICQVWASKWTDRAWLSRKATGLSEEALLMGCLLQKVVPAEYAFVIHTVHPISKDKSEMFCEVVPGLGEVLVGNYRGTALSFTISKDDNASGCHNYLPL